MANSQTGAIDAGFIDKRRGRDAGSVALADNPAYVGVPNLRGRLGGMAKVTADGANTITVDSTALLTVGQQIDVVNPTTGAASFSNRQITTIAALVVTYSGADATASVNDVVCLTGQGATVKYHTAARLDQLTVNDMVYATRLSGGDAAGI